MIYGNLLPLRRQLINLSILNISSKKARQAKTLARFNFNYITFSSGLPIDEEIAKMKRSEFL